MAVYIWHRNLFIICSVLWLSNDSSYDIISHMNGLKDIRSNWLAVNLPLNLFFFPNVHAFELPEPSVRKDFFHCLVFTLCLHFHCTPPSKKTFGLSSEFWKDICIVDSLLTFAVEITRDNSFPNVPITKYLPKIN